MTTIKDFPKQITRPCCPGKSCGDVTLFFDAVVSLKGDEPVITYGYRRENFGWYYGPADLETLYKALEDSKAK